VLRTGASRCGPVALTQHMRMRQRAPCVSCLHVCWDLNQPRPGDKAHDCPCILDTGAAPRLCAICVDDKVMMAAAGAQTFCILLRCCTRTGRQGSVHRVVAELPIQCRYGSRLWLRATIGQVRTHSIRATRHLHGGRPLGWYQFNLQSYRCFDVNFLRT
jgi:hypothetical protein